ncbi:histidinol dehydrogenase [Alkalibaculum bacchi]|uniref:Histidinol dehydrogenase n=1 Tax=Alkalibaculum bacchi TaxID=645887 RepID=A0A366HY56_9FIRM|nr:histidinol dehydrogenase [Alkalibaculum bacchi]RBP58754.1 histidinol dehydrogenase [Alkalibaculum bacchi]
MNKYFLKKQDLIQSNIDKILNRVEDENNKVEIAVKDIIERVKKDGDAALISYTKEFDKVELSQLKVTDEEIEEAFKQTEPGFIRVLEEAKGNIIEFHKCQVQETWKKEFSSGVVLGQKVTPIPRVGLYVPGGKGGYPSTVLMDAIPAMVAGVDSIALITPPNSEGKVNSDILAAARVAGITEIYKVGGAQGIAALAYGTETIPAVNKIVGPGNIFVATAKKLVFGKVDIDMIAGPSEICIIANSSNNPVFIAADMLSQAEHDEMASSFLITTDESLADKVSLEVERQLELLPRKEIIKKSIQNNGKIFVVETLEDAIELSNIIAPEHLEIMVEEPFHYLDFIKNAGAIFLGEYTPEPVGDYFAGPNHTLPTSGTSKFSSPLGVYDFVKKSSIIFYEKKSLENIKDQVIQFAQREGFDAHGNTIKVRFEEN